MSHLIFIFTEIILPIFVLIVVGVVMQRAFKLDLYTLAKINIYFLSPALIFNKLYESELSFSLLFQVIFFISLLIVVLWMISYVIAKGLNLDDRMHLGFSNSIIFYNSANYGIPVNALVFKQDPLAMSIQISVAIFQNVLLFSYGTLALSSARTGRLQAIVAYFKMPVFYALFLGILFKMLAIPIPQFLYTPIAYTSDALIAIALLTLGAQIAHIKPSLTYAPLYLSVFTRLVVGPVVAFIIILLFGFQGVIAQALLISSAMPTSVNSSIIAQEYNNVPEYAAQTVVVSTLFSSITLTFVIYLAMYLF